MGELYISAHPLIQHKLTIMRDKHTDSKDFRGLLREISTLMVYELTQNLPLEETETETPIKKMKGVKINGKDLAVIPILRAGLGMVDGLLYLIPTAKVGHIGLYREPQTHNPVTYYCKLPPDIDRSTAILVDPMLATGGSASDAIKILKEKGCADIRLMCLVAAPEGVRRIQKDHPGVDIYTAALDECLDDRAYIVPGLGDAGDRLFGTN